MAKIKFVVRQANSINLYKKVSFKLLKCCANIYFNKQCLVISPKITFYIIKPVVIN